MRREWFPCSRSRIPLTTFLISRARAATQDLSQHSPLATPPGRLQPAAEPILLSLWYFTDLFTCAELGSQAQSCVCSLHNPCGHPESEIGVPRSQDRSSQRCFHRWIQRNCGISPLPLVVPRFPSLLPKTKGLFNFLCSSTLGEFRGFLAAQRDFLEMGTGRQTLQNSCGSLWLPVGECGSEKNPIIALFFRFSADMFITVLHGGKNLSDIHRETWSPTGDNVISVTCGSRSYL